MNLAELQAELRRFAAEREWAPLLTPKNMSTALMVGAAELAGIFQWMTPEESALAHQRLATRQRVGDALADVLLYLLHMADQGGIGLEQAVKDKLAGHASKYPAKQVIPRVAPAQAVPPEVHILLDYENVQPTADELRAMVPGASQVWVFHGPHQKKIEQRFSAFGTNATAVPISKTGKNALDFHLAFYMGYIASRHPAAALVVVSNDKGYEPMLEHARTLGFEVRQQGHGHVGPVAKAKVAPSVKTAAKKAPAKKTPVKVVVTKPVAKAATRRAAATPAAKKAASVTQAVPKTAGPPAKKAVRSGDVALPTTPRAREALLKKVTDNLRKMGGKRPVRAVSLRRALKSFLGGDAGDQPVETLLGLLVAAGAVSLGAKGEISYPGFN